MKKLFSIFLGLILVMGLAGKVLAENSEGNGESGKKVPWNLSATVMPVPPYGSFDIPGSDVKSKLTVSQPRCDTKAKIKGEMKGLNPNTIYTIYLSNGYTPYVFTGWNVNGTYGINVKWEGVDYPETLILSQSGTNITGVSLDTVLPASYFVVDGGSIVGNIITIDAHKGSLVIQMTGTVASDGSMTGTWNDVTGDLGFRTGTWASTSGLALKTHTGDDWYTGLFTPTIPPFTFTTNDKGVGQWHLNLGKSDFPGTGPYTLSVWINGGGTMLISNNFVINVPSSDKQCKGDKDGKNDEREQEEEHDSRESHESGERDD